MAVILKKRGLPWWLIPSAGVLVLLASAWRVDNAGSIRSFREWSARTEVMLGKDRFSKRKAMLAKLGFLSVSRFYSHPHPLASDSKPARRLFGGPCPEPDESRFNPEIPPSTSLLPSPRPAVPEDTVILSLVCGAKDLFDKNYGIIAQAEKHGRNWERLAWATALQGDRKILEQPLGLRIHGGTSRKGNIKSLRLVFHRRYAGEPESPAGLFFGEDTPPQKSVVLMNGSRPQWVIGAMMLELAAKAGCQTSRVRPAVVYLNGQLIPAPYFLIEHQTPHFLKAREHLRNFDFFRLKEKNQTGSGAFRDFRRALDGPLTLEEAEQLYDPNDLTAWGFMISFGVISDNNQGSYFRDRETPGSLWRSLTWDLDGAFQRWNRVPEKDGVRDYMAILSGYRGQLCRQLMRDSPEFRRRFIRFALEKLRGSFSAEGLEPLLARYETLAATHPGTYRKLEPELRKILTRLRQQPARYEAYLRHTWPEDYAAAAASLPVP